MYIELKDINKRFGDFEASKNVSFGIEKGKLIGLLGPSGSGKTTILRMLAGLERQDSGDIYINDVCVNNLPASQRGIGFVFQNFNLFPHFNLLRNITASPVTVLKQATADAENNAMELLKELHNEGTTIIMVTHSQHDANYADRVVNLFDGEIVSEVEM